MNKIDFLPNIYVSLKEEFSSRGFSLFIVGGTSRDILLKKEITDLDFVTDATIDEMKLFLTSTYSNVGSMTIKYLDKKVDLTTLRKESEYLDYRHPSKVTFIKDPKEDSLRRDFTLNAIYIDKNGNILDYHNGLEDLKNKKLVFIGEANKRIKEDPLRILRGIRFSLIYNFDITFNKEIEDNLSLLKKIPIRKSFEELNKLKEVSSICYRKAYEDYHLERIFPFNDIKDNKNIYLGNERDLLILANQGVSLYLMNYRYYYDHQEEFLEYNYLYNICLSYEDYFKTKEASKISIYLYENIDEVNENVLNDISFIEVKETSITNKVIIDQALVEEIKNNNLHKVLSLLKKSDKINKKHKGEKANG